MLVWPWCVCIAGCVHVSLFPCMHGVAVCDKHARVLCVCVCVCVCVSAHADLMRQHGSRRGWNWCQYNALATPSTRRAKRHRAAAA